MKHRYLFTIELQLGEKFQENQTRLRKKISENWKGNERIEISGVNF